MRVCYQEQGETHPAPGSKRSSDLHKMNQCRCTTKKSWWWRERLPETCRVVIPIKLEFSASVGFIHKEEASDIFSLNTLNCCTTYAWLFSLASNSLCFWFSQWRFFFHSSTIAFKWLENIADRRTSSSCHKCICMDIRNGRWSVNGSVFMSFTHKRLNYSQLLTHGNVRQTTWHAHTFGCKRHLMYEERH